MRWIRTHALNYMGVLFVVTMLALYMTGGDYSAIPVTAELVQTTNHNGQTLVIIDAGHGGFDNGAIGIDTGVHEDELNLAVAKLVEKGLRQNDIAVVMTRSSEDAIASTKQQDMQGRATIMNDANAVAVVSIHMNMFEDRAVKGPMSFYMQGSAEGERLATAVLESVCSAIDHSKRTANHADYFVLRESVPPAVIIECGFLSNPSDEVLLQDGAHQQKIADGIVEGILSYLGDYNPRE